MGVMLYPIGIQSFEDLRESGCVYVDKTAFVHQLVSAGKYYFLSRPRRFGKSLLLSTLKAYFERKRKLFEGLAIEKLEQDWTEYPVLYLDLNSGNYSKNKRSLNNQLNTALCEWETLYETSQSEVDPEQRFKGVIKRAYEKTGRKAVVLIDEYDKPLVETIDNREWQEEYRATLKAFYSVLKTQDQYIRFAFLTGVSRFGKVSVFSDLNNLDDISMDARYSTVCGITESEIDAYFSEEVAKLAEGLGVSATEARQMLKEQYNGYHFCDDCEGIYNPLSFLKALDKQKLSNYWFDTATPSMLVKLLKETNYRLDNLGKATATADLLGSIETMHSNPIPMIYQTGYLTIQGYDPRFRRYCLGFPNREVEESFMDYLLPYYITSANSTASEFFIEEFVGDVEGGRTETFLKRLKAMFAGNDYKIAGDKELYFQNTVYVIFRIMGFYIEVERDISDGRIDFVLKVPGYIYIIEFKLDGSAEEALQQIEEKNYAAPYAFAGKTIIKVGVNFSSETRNITDWKIKE